MENFREKYEHFRSYFAFFRENELSGKKFPRKTIASIAWNILKVYDHGLQRYWKLGGGGKIVSIRDENDGFKGLFRRPRLTIIVES